MHTQSHTGSSRIIAIFLLLIFTSSIAAHLSSIAREAQLISKRSYGAEKVRAQIEISPILPYYGMVCRASPVVRVRAKYDEAGGEMTDVAHDCI